MCSPSVHRKTSQVQTQDLPHGYRITEHHVSTIAWGLPEFALMFLSSTDYVDRHHLGIPLKDQKSYVPVSKISTGLCHPRRDLPTLGGERTLAGTAYPLTTLPAGPKSRGPEAMLHQGAEAPMEPETAGR